MQGTVLCTEMTRVLYLFIFLRNLQFRWRQQTKCNEVYKCYETEAHKGVGHKMEGGLSHCKA